MTRSVFEFTKYELRRINEISDAIDAKDTESLAADDILLWGEWQAAIVQGEMQQLMSVEEHRAKIAERKAESLNRAADALNRLADLAEKAGKDV